MFDKSYVAINRAMVGDSADINIHTGGDSMAFTGLYLHSIIKDKYVVDTFFRLV